MPILDILTAKVHIQLLLEWLHMPRDLEHMLMIDILTLKVNLQKLLLEELMQKV